MAENTSFGRIAKYVANVANEYAQWDAKRTKANTGQFYGALLQGRRYDTNGNLLNNKVKRK